MIRFWSLQARDNSEVLLHFSLHSGRPPSPVAGPATPSSVVRSGRVGHRLRQRVRQALDLSVALGLKTLAPRNPVAEGGTRRRGERGREQNRNSSFGYLSERVNQVWRKDLRPWMVGWPAACLIERIFGTSENRRSKTNAYFVFCSSDMYLVPFADLKVLGGDLLEGAGRWRNICTHLFI